MIGARRVRLRPARGAQLPDPGSPGRARIGRRLQALPKPRGTFGAVRIVARAQSESEADDNASLPRNGIEHDPQAILQLVADL